jgi:hypothetical protein
MPAWHSCWRNEASRAVDVEVVYAMVGKTYKNIRRECQLALARVRYAKISNMAFAFVLAIFRAPIWCSNSTTSSVCLVLSATTSARGSCARRLALSARHSAHAFMLITAMDVTTLIGESSGGSPCISVTNSVGIRIILDRERRASQN